VIGTARYHVALDVGTKTIGLARAAVGTRLAHPQHTLSRRGLKRDIPALCDIFASWGTVETAVVGMPYELDGSEGRSARLARQVGEALEQRGFTVAYQDERFSTVEASRRLHEGGMDSRRQKGVIDQAAAAVILEDWLESQG
jgi:putative Holliday junction resolvase